MCVRQRKLAILPIGRCLQRGLHTPRGYGRERRWMRNAVVCAAAEADADHCLFRSQSHNGMVPLSKRTRAHSPDPPASCAVEPTRECGLCCFGLLRGWRNLNL